MARRVLGQYDPPLRDLADAFGHVLAAPVSAAAIRQAIPYLSIARGWVKPRARGADFPATIG
jgi:stage V sporulation protein SpoVS